MQQQFMHSCNMSWLTPTLLTGMLSCSGQGVSITLQSMSSAALADALKDKVSNALTSKFEKAEISLFWACSGKNLKRFLFAPHSHSICLGTGVQTTFADYPLAYFSATGADPAKAECHASDIAVGDRLQIEKRHKKMSQWYAKLL